MEHKLDRLVKRKIIKKNVKNNKNKVQLIRSYESERIMSCEALEKYFSNVKVFVYEVC